MPLTYRSPPPDLRIRPGELDFFGDIHGQAGVLTGALRTLGYRCRNGTWRHRWRRAVFLGDMLNRGPEIRATTRIIRRMVDAGAAEFLLGNHELFALWDAATAGTGPALPAKVLRHLQDTRQAFARAGREWQDLLEWLLRRPVVFDAGVVRGIHACWDNTALRHLPDNRVRRRDLLNPGGVRFRALWRVLEGPSVRHAESGQKFRVRWWESSARRWADFAYSPKMALPTDPLPVGQLRTARPYGRKEPPLFFGHYGFAKPCAALRPNLACLDLAVAQGGPIGVYRWSGESSLRQENFRAFG